MDKIKYAYSAVSVFLLLVFISGCSGYGSIRNESKFGDATTIEELVENWDDYHVYYSGYAVNTPSGIMFDPKKDDKTLTPSDRWVKVDSGHAASEIVSWIKIYDYPWYSPRLFRIIGPDGERYGYMYTGWDQITAKASDDRTLFVYDLPDPPQYYGPGDSHSSRVKLF